MESGLDIDAFFYQIDIVVPNCETSFSEINDQLNKSRFYMVSQVTVDKILDKFFVENFLNKGKIYLLSYNTRLDNHDCISLLPTGRLILNLTQSTYEKIPIEFSKKTSKSTGFVKYECDISLSELLRDEKKLVLLKKIFSEMSFSFFTYWKSDSDDLDYDSGKKRLEAYFGSNVASCLNRIDKKSVACHRSLVEKYLNGIDLSNFENWSDCENFTGCLMHNIDPLKLNFSVSEDENESKLNGEEFVSFFRMKGFMPTRILDETLELIGDLLETNETTKQIFIKFHGFEDSPVPLFLSESNNLRKIRVNQENYVSMCFAKSGAKKPTLKNAYFTDFDKYFSFN